MNSNDNIRDGFDDLLDGLKGELEAKKTPDVAQKNPENTTGDVFFPDIDSFEDTDDEDIEIDISSKTPKSTKDTDNNAHKGAAPGGTRVFDTIKPEKNDNVAKASSGSKAPALNEYKQSKGIDTKGSSGANPEKAIASSKVKKTPEITQSKAAGNTKDKKPQQLHKPALHKPVKNTVSEKPVTAKRHKKRKKNTGLLGGVARFVAYICFIAISSIICSYLIISFANDMFAFAKDSQVVTVEIPEGASTKEVSKILSENDIVDNPTIFRFYTNFKKGKSKYYTDGFKSGSFELSPSMNYDDLIFALSNSVGTREVVRLTFPEGSTVDEIIDILIEGGVENTREEYIDVIQNFDYDYRFINELDTENFKNGRKYRLEGYLFPDTYDFYTDASAVDVINKFLVNFNNKFDTTFYDAAQSHGLTVDEIINIASLIEKEARKRDDFGNVSSVFHNRLKNAATYPYIQSDATIQYAFPERKTKITPEDLKYDSPYNTYIYAGLPPSAIANPGLDAITAALYPEDTSYYYFISASTGETLFAKTLDGHNANIAMIRKESGN